MAASSLGIEVMAKKTMAVRLTDEAIRWARIASGYTGESMVEYVSRVVARARKGRCQAAPRRSYGREAEAIKRRDRGGMIWVRTVEGDELINASHSDQSVFALCGGPSGHLSGWGMARNPDTSWISLYPVNSRTDPSQSFRVKM